MRLRSLESLAMLVCGMLSNEIAGAEALFTVPLAPDGVGVERGLAQLVCADADGAHYSRGAILEVGTAAAGEVILVAAHGLPANGEQVRRDCRITGPGDRAYDIKAAWWSAGRSDDKEHDWAVLLTARRINGTVRRLRAEELPPMLLAEEAPLRLLLYRREAEEHDCHFQAASAGVDTVDEGAIFAHSCRSWPGLSGSPILVAADGEPIVIGLHVGWRFTLAPQGLVISGVGRAIDEEVAGAIAAAAARAND